MNRYPHWVDTARTKRVYKSYPAYIMEWPTVPDLPETVVWQLSPTSILDSWHWKGRNWKGVIHSFDAGFVHIINWDGKIVYKMTDIAGRLQSFEGSFK